MTRSPLGVGNRILRAGRVKSTQAQDAAFTHTARPIFPAITRPGQIKRGFHFQPQFYDFYFAQCDQWRNNLDFAFPGAGFYHFVECAIVCRAAIGITRAVLLHGADIDPVRLQYFGPAYSSRKKMGIAKRDIGDRDRSSADLVVLAGPMALDLRDVNGWVGKR